VDSVSPHPKKQKQKQKQKKRKEKKQEIKLLVTMKSICWLCLATS
jgi:hypothetical protein